MEVIIANRDKFIRREISGMLTEMYPNSSVEWLDDILLAAKRIYVKPCDAFLAGIDGIKLIPMLKKKSSSITVVIIADNELHRDEAYSAGADAYVTRPFTREMLFSAVEGTYSLDY